MAGQAKLSILIAAKDDSAGALQKASNAIGGIAKAAAVGALAAGAAIVGMGVAAFKLGSDFDEAYDTIRVSTGKTGDALEGLKEDFRAVARDVPADFDQIGVAIGDLSARTGLTGDDLQDLAGDMLNLTRIAGGDLKGNISTITRTFGDWGIATDDQSDALNQMFRATQKTGISMSSLNEMLVTFGAPLRQLGFSFAESAGLIGKFEKEGVNTELVMGSLRIALGKMAKAGQPVRETLLGTVDAIKKAGSASEANAIALKLFGAKAGPDMAAAIREGRFELGELFTQITEGSETIGAAAADTEDAAEKWKKTTNKMKLAVEPLALTIFDLVSKGLDKLAPAIEAATPSLQVGAKKIADAIETAIGKIGDIVRTVKGVFTGDWVSSDKIDPITRAFGDFATVIRDALPTIQDVAGAIKEKLSDALQRINDLSPETKRLIEGVALAIGGLMIANQVVPGLAGLEAMLGQVALQLLKMGPAGWIALAGLAVAGGGALAYKNNWLGMRDALEPTFTWIGDRVGELFNPPKATGHDMPDTWVDNLKTSLAGAQTAVQQFWDTWTASGNDNPLAGTIAAFENFGSTVKDIAGSVLAFVGPSFERLWDAVRQFAVDVWPELQGALSAMAAFFGPILQNILNLVMTVFGGIANFIGEHKELIIGILKAMWTVLEGIVTVALSLIKGIIMIGLNLIQGDWEGAWDAMTEMLSGVWDGIQLIVSGALDYLKNLLALGWEAIKAVAGVAWDGIKAALSAKWEEIKSNLASMMDAYQTLISAAWEAIKSAITTKSSELVGIVTALPGQITAALGNLGSLLWNAGASLIQGFIDGIISKFAAVQQKLRELAGLLPSWKGPESMDRIILFPAGQAIMQGFIDGLEWMFPYVEKSLETVGEYLEAPLTDIAHEMTGGFADAFAEGWAIEVGPMLERAAGELRDVFDDIPAEFHTWGDEMSGGFADLPDVFDRVGDAWQIVGGKMLIIGDSIIDMTDQLDRAFQRVGDGFYNMLPPGGFNFIPRPAPPPPPGDYHALMPAAPTGPTGGNNLASLEDAVYRGAYRGTRAALAEAI